ncbi:tetratricopeptide repeat protein [Candidatus Gottesmanbacteria bacterium]|nr:tetratricopeptide repeat protein [Candidatus Gottesmanbacteria bacterium]
MQIDDHTRAINAALLCNWKDAEIINEKILRQNPKNTEALNRLAYSLLQQGKIEDAKRAYKKVIRIDKYNNIAQKNLQKLGNLKRIDRKANGQEVIINPNLFLEEPGKTRSVSLINVAPFSVLSSLTIGQEVFLSPKRFSIEVRDRQRRYIGGLPDDLSFRLLRFLKEGNTYRTIVKSITKNASSVFLKEIKRMGKFKNQPSFITPISDYQTSVHRELLEETRQDDKDDKEDEDD